MAWPSHDADPTGLRDDVSSFLSLSATKKVAEAWRAACRRVDRLDARLLVEYVSGWSQAELLAHPTRPLSTEQLIRLDALLERRERGEPLAYLVGSTGFYGREFAVDPGVLIPRPETELLIELAVDRLGTLQAPSIVDLGTGSGVLIVTLGRLYPAAKLTAVDLSPAALKIARENARRHAVEVCFLAGDWFSPLEGRQFDLIVANPPYVADGDPHLLQNGLPFEPQMALSDGVRDGDGLGCLRVIAAGALPHLKPGGYLLVENGYDQAAAVRALLAQGGLVDVVSWPDLAGIERVTGGRSPT